MNEGFDLGPGGYQKRISSRLALSHPRVWLEAMWMLGDDELLNEASAVFPEGGPCKVQRMSSLALNHQLVSTIYLHLGL